MHEKGSPVKRRHMMSSLQKAGGVEARRESLGIGFMGIGFLRLF